MWCRSDITCSQVTVNCVTNTRSFPAAVFSRDATEQFSDVSSRTIRNVSVSSSVSFCSLRNIIIIIIDVNLLFENELKQNSSSTKILWTERRSNRLFIYPRYHKNIIKNSFRFLSVTWCICCLWSRSVCYVCCEKSNH